MPEELVELTKTKGLQVIRLSQPTRTVVNNVDNINWSIDSTSLTKLSTLDFSLSNVVIVMTYKDLKYDKCWHLLDKQQWLYSTQTVSGYNDKFF